MVLGRGAAVKWPVADLGGSHRRVLGESFWGGFRGRVEVRAIELDVGLDSDGSSWEQDMG